jgi:hypothetical protein
MARGVEITPEVRAQVIAELLTGAGVNETARKYSLGAKSVSRIKASLAEGQLTQVDTEKRRRIDDVLMDCVTRHTEALNRFVEYVCQPEYLKTKEPDALGRLYEKLANTPLSILEAASAADTEDTGEQETEEAEEG